MTAALNEDDRRVLWEQFVETHSQAQETYDSSVRAFAAAGVAITVSLGTALEQLDGLGLVAVLLFLAALACNLVSYWTSQHDMEARLRALRDGRTEGIEGSTWTTATRNLNYGAGVGVVAGGIGLALFVSSAI